MANCNDLFERFYSDIDLPPGKMKSLRESRDAIEDVIKKYFKEELKARVPEFEEQGSFAMRTVINPIYGEYDIDDGVYLKNLADRKEEKPTAETVHGWIVNAMKGHTDEPPKDKRTCIRVTYKNKYHVDLPIYGTWEGKIFLAKKGESDWPESNPQEFTHWFLGKVAVHGAQLRRNVQYLKAWADYKSVECPSIAISILVCNSQVNAEARDDQSLLQTVRGMIGQLEISRSVQKPVAPFENVLAKFSSVQIDTLIEKLKLLERDADAAVNLTEDKKSDASKRWNRQFGDRFPIEEDEKDSSPTIRVRERTVTISAPAKPWSN